MNNVNLSADLPVANADKLAFNAIVKKIDNTKTQKKVIDGKPIIQYYNNSGNLLMTKSIVPYEHYNGKELENIDAFCYSIESGKDAKDIQYYEYYDTDRNGIIDDYIDTNEFVHHDFNQDGTIDQVNDIISELIEHEPKSKKLSRYVQDAKESAKDFIKLIFGGFIQTKGHSSL